MPDRDPITSPRPPAIRTPISAPRRPRVSLPQDGLVAYWKIDEPVGSQVLTNSALADRNHLQVGSTGGPDPNDPTLDGTQAIFSTDDFLIQPVVEGGTKQGDVTMSMINGTAFINDTSQTNFPNWAGKSSGRRHLIVLFDGTYYAFGYIGEVGTEETLGNDVVGNGDFSSDSVWVKDTAWTISAGQAHFDGSEASNIRQSGILEVGALYNYSIDLTHNAGSSASILMGVETDIPIGVISSTITGDYTCHGNTILYIYARLAANHDIDNFIVKKVLTPTANGINIYPTPTAVTSGWTHIDTGFNANNVQSYEVRSADFKFGADTDFSIFAYIKIVSDSGWGILVDTRSDSTTGFAFAVNYDHDNSLVFRTSTSIASSLSIDNNNWHLVGISVDRSANEVTFWLDEDSETLSFVDENLDSTAALIVGASSFGSGNYLNGAIGQSAIWRAALDADEVATVQDAMEKIQAWKESL